MSDAALSPDQWLIRTHRNVIVGPYPKDEIVRQIKEGLLTQQDEVCHANDYWIYLHERDEVIRQLGVDIPKPGVFEEESTQTQTDTDLLEETTDPNMVPELSQSLQEIGENPSVMANRAFRSHGSQPVRKNPRSSNELPTGMPSSRSDERSASIEGASIWRLLAAVLIVCAVFVMFLVLRKLRGPS